jgi:hypothetical protein
MDLRALLIFFSLICGGIWLGSLIDGKRGGLFAGCLIFLGLPLFGIFFTKMIERHPFPACLCGNETKSAFKPSSYPNCYNVWACSCGLRYSMVRGKRFFDPILWFLLEDMNITLLKKQSFWGKWIDPTEKDFSKYQPDTTRVRNNPV